MRFIDEMRSLATPVIEANGCELVDAEFKKEGQDKILRFYVEALNGRVSLDTCADINRAISDLLDSIETLQEQFILEVSSPGVNRVLNKLKDYERFCGSKVDVSLYQAAEGLKKFTAVLNRYQDGVFEFVLENKKPLEIKQSNIGKINLHFEFK